MRIPFTHKDVSVAQLFTKYLFPLVSASVAEVVMLGPWRRPDGTVIVFGHDRNGNLAALERYLATLPDAPPVMFMTDSAATYRRAKAAGEEILYSAKLSHLIKAAKADVIVTSHGPINLLRWQKRRHRPLFFEVWHGVGYKTDQRTIASMMDYNGHLVASPLLRDLHIEFGLPESMLTITGYARTDELAVLDLTSEQRGAILSAYGLDAEEKRTLVLYAPTWNHHDPLDIFPFDQSPEEFLAPLDALAAEIGALVLVRLHLNTVIDIDESAFTNVVQVPARLYPSTEPLLKIADVLVTDWSSIMSEYLALKRPIVFIDKTPPFSGAVHPLSIEDRPGSIVTDFAELADALRLAVTRPQAYLDLHADRIAFTTGRAWGDTLDGRSSERYWTEIRRQLDAR